MPPFSCLLCLSLSLTCWSLMFFCLSAAYSMKSYIGVSSSFFCPTGHPPHGKGHLSSVGQDISLTSLFPFGNALRLRLSIWYLALPSSLLSPFFSFPSFSCPSLFFSVPFPVSPFLYYWNHSSDKTLMAPFLSLFHFLLALLLEALYSYLFKDVSFLLLN